MESKGNSYSVSIGYQASKSYPGERNISIGYASGPDVSGTERTVSIGDLSGTSGNYSIALGAQAVVNGLASIQLGQGNNSTAGTLQVWTYPLLDKTTGLIPTGRLGSGTQDSTTFLRGDGTWQEVSGGSSTLDGLTDVVITTAASGDILSYNGTNWVNNSNRKLYILW